MITRFHVQNYKALRDVSIDLTRVHVLIGPNDSGKTSILEALLAFCRSVDHPLLNAFTGVWEGSTLVWRGEVDENVTLCGSIAAGTKEFSYKFSCRFAPWERTVKVASEEVNRFSADVYRPNWTDETYTWVLHLASGLSPRNDEELAIALPVHAALSGAHYHRWNPRFLALPVAPDSSRRFRMESSGFGLARCLDDILGYDRDRFAALENRFKLIFPSVRSIKLIPEMAYRSPSGDTTQVPVLRQGEGKGIYFQTVASDRLVSAAQASDGLLLVLAYLTVLYLPEPPRVIMVEEPENGIHPKRLEDVLNIVRQLVGESGQTQVVLTTHSPYVVDLFRPEEVSLCKKEADGSVSVHRLSESKAVREQLDVFTLGEIWTAAGDDALTVATDGRAQGEAGPQ